MEDLPYLPAADSGELKFRFLMASGDDNLLLLAEQLEQPPVALPVPAKAGPLPRQGSLVHIEPENLRLLAFKPAEDGKGWILRLQEIAGRTVQPRLTLVGKTVSLDEVSAGRIATWRVALELQGISTRRCDALERDVALH